MNYKLDLLKELIIGDDGFLIQLRMGEGLNEEKYNLTCEIIKEIALEWENKDVVPKKAAELFVDLYHSMISFTEWHNEEENEKITQAAVHISELIRDFFE